jgi:hypothetical protein
VNPQITSPPPAPPEGTKGHPSAVLVIGGSTAYGVHLTPVEGTAAHGEMTLLLGYTRGGHPITLIITRLEWLDDLESVIQRTRAAGVVEAEMTRPYSDGGRL